MAHVEPHPLDGLLYQQRDLEHLCAERPLDWEEYAHMNEFHGNAATLKRFAGLPLDDPLPLAIEHAIPYDLKKPYDYDLNCALPTFLAVHEESARIYRSGGMEYVEPIGFVQLYALDVFQRLHPNETERARRGTIVFPDKSTLLMDTDFDRAAFAQRLMELPEEFQPVVVCLYWRDFVRGRHRPFEEAGLPVVSAGHLRDPDFPLRLHDLCRRFRYSCANDLAGSFVASVLSGCHFFHLPTTGLTQQKYGVTSHFECDPTLMQPHKAACIAASPFPPQSPDEQRDLVKQHAGTRLKKTPDQLREIVDEARQRLRRGLAPCAITLDQATSAESLRMLHRMLPVGIDRDGWARKRCRLRIANTDIVAAARLRLAFRMDVEVARQVMEIFLNGRPIRSHVPPPFGPSLLLEINAAEGDAVIDFISHDEFPLESEPRCRSFRIACVDLLSVAELARINEQANSTKPKPVAPCPSIPLHRSLFSRLAAIFRRCLGPAKSSTRPLKSRTRS
ncbi:MAG: hypothetical protein K8R87_08760 [Verrucomicrobia bacterium]|nr:hypothetical protein [Verrucomicrobiota bacterium]